MTAFLLGSIAVEKLNQEPNRGLGISLKGISGHPIPKKSLLSSSPPFHSAFVTPRILTRQDKGQKNFLVLRLTVEREKLKNVVYKLKTSRELQAQKIL